MSRLPSYRLLVVFVAIWSLTPATVGVVGATWKVDGGAVKAVKTAVNDIGVVTDSTRLLRRDGHVGLGARADRGEGRAGRNLLSLLQLRRDLHGPRPGRRPRNPPLEIVFDRDNLQGAAHSMQFVASVPAGQHTVKIQYKVGSASGSLFGLSDRTLTVLRSKV